jgi:hypothetical protein
MDVSIRKLSLGMKLHKVGGTVIHHQAILVRWLRQVQKLDCELVDGYVLTGDNESCWHCWVEAGDKKYDIAWLIANLPDTRNSLVRQIPEHCERMDLKDERGRYVVDENMRLFDLFNSDEKKFWEEAPDTVKKFRYSKYG